MLSPDELAVREFERTLELKTLVESKAASYMIVVTLIMTMLTEFFLKVKNFDLNSDKCCVVVFTIFYILAIALGIVLLLVFVYIQKPRHIQYLPFSELVKMTKDEKKSNEAKSEEILDTCSKCVSTNQGTIKKIDSLHRIVTASVPVLIFLFFIEFIFFIVFMSINNGGVL